MIFAIFKLVGKVPDDIGRFLAWARGLLIILDTYLANMYAGHGTGLLDTNVETQS